MRVFRALVLGMTILASASGATAQTQDWDMQRSERPRGVSAYTVFTSGLGIVARCMDGRYETYIAGLPGAGDVETRELHISFGEEAPVVTRWNVGREPSIAVSEVPAVFARKLREGGLMRVLIPNGAPDGRNLRHDLTLPVSNSAIDETLTACNRPLVDPRDAELEGLGGTGLPEGTEWVTRPPARYPEPLKYGRGFAVIRCLANPDGSLRDCTAESEYPYDGGFGREALRAAARGRIGVKGSPGTPVPPTMVLFRVNFLIAGYETRQERDQMREQRAREREERRSRSGG